MIRRLPLPRPTHRAQTVPSALLLAACAGCGQDESRDVVEGGWSLPGEASLIINPVTPTLEVQGDAAYDPHTGLMWDRAFQDATPDRWQDPQPAVALATATCDALVLAGYDDWRLPTRLELHSIADHGRCRPAIDEVAFPDTPGEFRSPFWTSTSHFQGAEGLMQFAVGFHIGEITYDGDVTSPVHARCVRATRLVPPPASDFEIAGEVVRDLRTGLEWQRQASSQDFLDWTLDPIITAAEAHCAGLNLNGRGWRLPTVKELNTIVAEGRVQPVIDETIFPGTERAWYMTSTPLGCSQHLGWYWAVSFGDGASYPMDQAYTDTAYARCVRGTPP